MDSDNESNNVDPTKQIRNWPFTWNNYPSDWKDKLKLCGYAYLIVGQEVGEEKGTPHLQGYMHFKSPKRLGTLVKALPGPNYRIAKGSLRQNQAYCSKGEQTKAEWKAYKKFHKDGNFGPNYGKNAQVYEDGTPPHQGEREDLEEVREIIKGGATALEIADSNFPLWCRNHKAFDKYKYLVEEEQGQKWRHVEVEYWFGVGDSKKTSRAMNSFGRAYKAMQGVSGFWWTGYDGHKTVVMDEFRGGIPISQLLGILDGHPMQVSVHGGMAWLLCTTIIITSNEPFDALYTNCSKETRAALRRRIQKIVYFPWQWEDPRYETWNPWSHDGDHLEHYIPTPKYDDFCDVTEVSGGNTTIARNTYDR